MSDPCSDYLEIRSNIESLGPKRGAHTHLCVVCGREFACECFWQVYATCPQCLGEE